MYHAYENTFKYYIEGKVSTNEQTQRSFLYLASSLESGSRTT